MRQLISGMVAAVAVMAAAPAMACGYGSCSPCGYGYYTSPCTPPVYAAPVYSAPVWSYNYTSGCGGCGPGYGWVTERLPDPEQQYYYVNQGPTYTGPGNWAPVPTYQEAGSRTIVRGVRATIVRTIATATRDITTASACRYY